MIRRLLVLIAISSPLMAQAASEPAGSHSCQIQEVFKADGWDIPGLGSTAVKLERGRFDAGTEDEIFVTMLESKSPEASITTLSCSRGAAGRITYRDQPVDVREIWRFEKNGHAFAYKVTTTWMGVEGKSRYPLGTAMTLLFYDPDGTGRFSVMRYSDVDFPFKLIIPDWVKQLPNSNK